MSYEDFLAFVEARHERCELVKGERVMLSRVSQRHQNVAANILARLHTQLRGKKCRASGVGTGVSTSSATVRYPDVVVDCGRRDDLAVLATNPTVVIDVLSPSARAFDSHLKVLEYKAKQIGHILLIDTESACVLLHHRDGGEWCEEIYDALDDVIELPEIGATLSLSEIYEGLDFSQSRIQT